MEWGRWRYVLPLRMRSVWRRKGMEQELDEELRFHLECKEEEERARGVEAREARYQALRALGGVEQRKEEMRDMRRVNWLVDFAADVRYALRMVGHTRLFTALVVLTLGLGIGANSAMFSLADALLLRPLPVLRPSEVVTVSSFTTTSASGFPGRLSYRDYVDYRDKNKSFSGLAAFADATSLGFAARPGELPQLKGGLLVSGNLFRVMGVQPEVGRAFSEEEDQVAGRNAVVVLGNRFWRTQFGGDRAVIGRRVLLDGVEFSVIGVAPEEFNGLDQYFQPDLYLPLMMGPRLAGNAGKNPLEDRGNRYLNVKGRLKPGVSVVQARAELGVIAEQLRRAYPKSNKDQKIAVRTELELRLQSDTSDAALLMVLLALAGAVLLIACANVASLLLGRARTRSREIAVRLAIGAGRWRLIRLLLAEGLLMAAMGAAVGIVLGYGGVRFFQNFNIPTDMPIRLVIELDRRVFLFSLAVAMLSAIFCGLAPALQASRTNLVTALKAGDIDVPGRRRLWGRNTLVVLQVAASLALLTSAMQMIRAFEKKWSGGPGFRTERLLTASFDPHMVRYTEAHTQRFYEDLIRRVRLLPGVKSAALTGGLPMSVPQFGVSVIPEGYSLPKGKESLPVDMTVAGDGYFKTLDVQLVQGRGFLASDTASSTKVAVVNEQFARHYWPGKEALGRRFRIDDANGPVFQVVGLAKTAKYEWMGEPATEFVYLPWTQHARSELTLLLATDGPSAALAEPVRELVRSLYPGQPLFNVRTIEQFYAQRVMGAPVMIVETVCVMGLIGLALALGGLYGLVSYAAERRTREIGIRMAVGADATSVLKMVLRQALLLVASGICVGLLLGLAMERGLNSVFQTAGIDVRAYLLILPVLLIVTTVAAFIPARRASRIEPSRALRME